MFRDDKIIRLRRKGHKHYPVFEIVVVNKYKRNRADFLERLGLLNPNNKERLLYINLNRLGF
jgi:ribosomal protein S16